MNSKTFKDIEELMKPLKGLQNCNYCPRNCNADRSSGMKGYCKSDDGFNIASICIHRGEEPVISGKNGICNIFFSRCNIQCVYCQNYQISRNDRDTSSVRYQLHQVIDQIVDILDNGIEAVGFVSPSHFIPQVIVIIQAIEQTGRKPVFVYNTNAYDKVSSLKMLEGIVDVYLPDFKYMDFTLAKELSDAPDYPVYAGLAIKEMYRQKGSTLLSNKNSYAESGLIIRHLVLPGYIENSLSVLRFIAHEISVNVHISLMSQYYPNAFVKGHSKLNRELSEREYKVVVSEMEKLGFRKGWIQEPSSAGYYNPDFSGDHPFRKSQ